MQSVLKRFDEPDESRTFEKGRITLGRARYEPGWKWSEHVGRQTGTSRCEVDHVGMVISGHARVSMKDGTIIDLTPGEVFSIGPGHDSWVVGDEPYVSLHFVGADEYAT